MRQDTPHQAARALVQQWQMDELVNWPLAANVALQHLDCHITLQLLGHFPGCCLDFTSSMRVAMHLQSTCIEGHLAFPDRLAFTGTRVGDTHTEAMRTRSWF